MATSTAVSEATGSIGTAKQTIRRYVKYDTYPESAGPELAGKTFISEQTILQETAKKDKDTGLSDNWAKAEKEGFTLFSENEVITYQVKSQEGFELLVPDETQRLYLIQVGLDSIQGARSQVFMKANKEGAVEPTPEYNDYTLDLRAGVGEDQEYSFNRAPSRKSLTDEEKLMKMLAATGMSKEAAATFLLSMAENMLQKGEEAAA
jgi:hypothetical protein